MEDAKLYGVTGSTFPTPYMRDAYAARFPAAALQRLETVFALKATAQQMTNVLNEWLASTAGSPARFQTLALLWGAGDRWVPHQEIIAALQVKRATVSALLFSLEQDGLVCAPSAINRTAAACSLRLRRRVGESSPVPWS